MNLTTRLQSFEKAVGGTVGFGLVDRTTNTRFFHNENHLFTAASINKLFLVSYIFNLITQGKLALNLEYKIPLSERVQGTGIIHLLTTETFTLHDLCLLSIIVSDNTAANKLIDLGGGFEPINQYITELGLKNTRITHKYMLYKGEDTSTTTVVDLVKFFEKLVAKELPMANELTEILTEQKERRRTAMAITAKYGFKTADLPESISAVHDAGVIFDEKGEIIYILLTEGVKNRRETMQKMAALTAEVMESLRPKDID